MDAFGLAVDEDLSYSGHAVLGRGSLDGKRYQEQQEAWMNQVREVQTWRQVRGPPGAVMCETRDLGIKWPFWQTWMFEGDRSIDMRYVCPKDVKKNALAAGQKSLLEKWAAKHEYEDLKEVTWLEPALALMRNKTKNRLE